MMQQIALNLEKLRTNKPLVHHLTNYVTVNDCANITLQAGGLPVMADALEEVAEMQAISNALVLNIGTLNPGLVEAMIKAGLEANRAGHPVILDPVGAGATSYRTSTAMKILEQVKVDVIKGNIAEIAVLVGLDATVRGVEAGEVSGDIVKAAQKFASAHQSTIAVTGKEDLVITANRIARISNGHPLMGGISGTGCMCTSVIACFLAVAANPWEAALSALACFGVAGELAAAETGSENPYSYKIALFDALHALNGSDLIRLGRVDLSTL